MNAQFADAVLEEIGEGGAPIVLVQDYHFALLPRSSSRRGPTRASRSSGTSRGRTSRPSASAPGRRRSCSGMLGRRPRRLPHPVPLQQLPGDGGARDRGPDRLGALHRRARPAHHLRAGRSRSAWRPRSSTRRRPTSREPCGPSSGVDRGVPGRRASSASTTPRACPSASRAIRRFFERYPEYRRAHGLRAARRAEPQRASPATRRCRQEVRETVRTDQRGARRAGLAADRLPRAPPRPPRDPAATTAAADFCMVTSLHDGMNLVAKEFVAGARRRRRRADPEPVHRRRPRAARRLPGQSLRRRRMAERPTGSPSRCARERRSPHGAHARRRCASTTSIGWAGLLLGRAGEDSPAAPRSARDERGRAYRCKDYSFGRALPESPDF